MSCMLCTIALSLFARDTFPLSFCPQYARPYAYTAIWLLRRCFAMFTFISGLACASFSTVCRRREDGVQEAYSPGVHDAGKRYVRRWQVACCCWLLCRCVVAAFLTILRRLRFFRSCWFAWDETPLSWSAAVWVGACLLGRKAGKLTHRRKGTFLCDPYRGGCLHTVACFSVERGGVSLLHRIKPPTVCIVVRCGARQDYPKSLGPEAKVGFTSVDPWLCFSPCKNNTADATKAQVSHSHSSAPDGISRSSNGSGSSIGSGSTISSSTWRLVH